jgi:hypothetical protein
MPPPRISVERRCKFVFSETEIIIIIIIIIITT